MSLTPVDAEATFGGTHETQTEEDNMVKVQTGDSSNAEYNADVVSQITNAQQEYPEWIILAFALAVGFALPSPISAYGSWRRSRRDQNEIKYLRSQLAATNKRNANEVPQVPQI